MALEHLSCGHCQRKNLHFQTLCNSLSPLLVFASLKKKDHLYSALTIHPLYLKEYPTHGYSKQIERIYIQFSSVTQSCPTFCNPINCNTPGRHVHHQLLEFTQTHVHRVSDAIQPSHPLVYPIPPALNPSQHQGLFQ